MAEARPVLFAGPTALGLAPRLLRGVEQRAPARRGDIDALLAEPRRRPGVVVLCDGVFQAVPAVGHAELCRALDAGWALWGVSSIGAIRAHELRGAGMRGFGWAYAQFARHADFTDDEFAQLHLGEPPWLPLSEPLVNVRHAVEVHGAGLGIGTPHGRALIDALAALWFGERTPERIAALLSRRGSAGPAAGARLLAWLEGHRIKTMDLQQLLEQRPWRRD